MLLFFYLHENTVLYIQYEIWSTFDICAKELSDFIFNHTGMAQDLKNLVGASINDCKA